LVEYGGYSQRRKKKGICVSIFRKRLNRGKFQYGLHKSRGKSEIVLA
jgi:hypothetical protein